MTSVEPGGDPSTSAEAIRVFLLADHEIVRRGVRHLLDHERDIVVVGEAGSVADALELIPSARPDVAVLDVQMEDGTGMEVCREIRATYPSINCLTLTSFADDEAMLASIVTGSSGYVLKQIRGNDLAEKIRRASTGASLLDPVMSARAVEQLLGGPDHEAPVASLTVQERKILLLLTDGLTNREIGERARLAEKAVQGYVSNVMIKLGMDRRAEAVVFGVHPPRYGLRTDG